MFKKIFVGSVCILKACTLWGAESKSLNIDRKVELLTGAYKLQKSICGKLLDYENIEHLSPEQIADYNLLQGLLSQITSDPINYYCQDVHMFSGGSVAGTEGNEL